MRDIQPIRSDTTPPKGLTRIHPRIHCATTPDTTEDVHTIDRWSRNLRVTLESLANLAMYDVALVSITENIDYSTPQGMLMTQLLGSFAQFFSNMLGTHVSKGLDQRATEGLHTGGIPFGYQSCWVKEHGERRQTC